MKATLLIQDYSIQCHLGCLPDEREQRQEIRVSLKLEFADTPPACRSDELKDTICYAQVCESMRAAATLKSFKTVEHLALEVQRALSEIIPANCRWDLRVHKVRPPIDGLMNGVIFQLGNLD